ncbi:MAG: DUF4143 domain-containing protein [Deltaproteobacteria bacterium]|nr:DUF4143 domain-containing protein [Deltaproteobacteria bacterium]
MDAEVSPHVFKPLYLDIGLANHVCGLKLTKPEELITVYEGGLAEQFIGQELLNLGHPFEENRLYYWSREEKNANAEIDYLLSYQNTVIPVEVKAGKMGSLKESSNRLFLIFFRPLFSSATRPVRHRMVSSIPGSARSLHAVCYAHPFPLWG